MARDEHGTEAMLRELVTASSQMHPDDLSAEVARVAQQAGARDVEIHVIDLAQRNLLPLWPRDPARSMPVVGSPAGDAYRRVEVVATPGPDATRLWVPVLDSAERVGVMALTVDADETDHARWRALGALAGELIVAKARYGDGLNRARRTRSTTVAAEMRWALLPPLTFRSERLMVTGLLEPAYEIAGDTFDYAVNGDTAHLAILDAMGHGLEASRMANVAVTSYRHSRREGLSLQDTAAAMDEVLQECFDRSRYVTGQMATLKVSTGHFRMLNMGHPLPLLLRGGRVLGELESEPMLPAGWGSKPAAIYELRLAPGDLVLMYTDGVTEARGPDDELYGKTRLFDLTDSLLGRGLPAEEVLRGLIEDIMAFQDFHARDDATVLLAGLPGRGD